MKINKNNFKEYFPQAGITFQRIMHGPFTPIKKMRQGDSFNMIRYITPEDILDIFEKRIEEYRGPKKDTYLKRWEYVILTAKKLKEKYE